jgi:putative (di)nucleoside polyphosphate hydrolase
MTPEEICRLPYRPCVGVMMVNANGLIFVAQRINTKGAWQMPQGGMDPGETPLQTGLRELWEETSVTRDKVSVVAETPDWLNYDLPHDLVPRLWHGQFRGQAQKYLLVRFNGDDDDINIATEQPEFDEWRWLPAGELVANIVPFKRDVYARVLSVFADKL